MSGSYPQKDSIALMLLFLVKSKEGKFAEIEEPSKIVFTANAINEGKVIFEHLTTVTFEKVDDKLKITVYVLVTKIINDAWAKPALSGMKQCWNQQFDKLVEFIKKGLENEC
jgi:uncharacterized protein YndB with AHSA1/START domain